MTEILFRHTRSQKMRENKTSLKFAVRQWMQSSNAPEPKKKQNKKSGSAKSQWSKPWLNMTWLKESNKTTGKMINQDKDMINNYWNKKPVQFYNQQISAVIQLT